MDSLILLGVSIVYLGTLIYVIRKYVLVLKSCTCFIKGVEKPRRAGNSVSTGFPDKVDEVTGDIIPAEIPLIKIKGPGSFISAEIYKQGGATDKTSVILLINGQNVVHYSFDRARPTGLTANNPYGIVVFTGLGSDGTSNDVKTMTIGFCVPLYFKPDPDDPANPTFELVALVEELGVSRITTTVVYSGELPTTGEGEGGLESPEE